MTGFRLEELMTDGATGVLRRGASRQDIENVLGTPVDLGMESRVTKRNVEKKRYVRNGAGRMPKKGPTVGASAIAGLRQGLAQMRGEPTPSLVVRKPVDVAAVRKGTGLS